MYISETSGSQTSSRTFARTSWRYAGSRMIAEISWIQMNVRSFAVTFFI